MEKRKILLTSLQSMQVVPDFVGLIAVVVRRFPRHEEIKEIFSVATQAFTRTHI
jgi:hypothetical protein